MVALRVVVNPSSSKTNPKLQNILRPRPSKVRQDRGQDLDRFLFKTVFLCETKTVLLEKIFDFKKKIFARF